MGYVNWDEGYRTGWSTYDGQHAGLFALVNDLHRGVEGFAPGDEAALAAKFGAFITLVREHATLEDELMAQMGHPPALDHAAAHAKFLAGLEAILAGGDFGPEAHPRILEALGKFKTHFEGEDEQGFLVLLRARFLS